MVVYEGQLDLICGTLGFEMWLRDSKWAHIDELQAAPRRVLRDANGATTGFVKHNRNLRVYFLMEAGHMVPIDGMIHYLMVFHLHTLILFQSQRPHSRWYLICCMDCRDWLPF